MAAELSWEDFLNRLKSHDPPQPRQPSLGLSATARLNSLNRWYRSAVDLFAQAEAFEAQAAWENSFIFYRRFAQFFLQSISAHPDYKHSSFSPQRTELFDHCQCSLLKIEELKKKMEKKFHQGEYSGKSEKKKEENQEKPIAVQATVNAPRGKESSSFAPGDDELSARLARLHGFSEGPANKQAEKKMEEIQQKPMMPANLEKEKIPASVAVAPASTSDSWAALRLPNQQPQRPAPTPPQPQPKSLYSPVPTAAVQNVRANAPQQFYSATPVAVAPQNPFVTRAFPAQPPQPIPSHYQPANIPQQVQYSQHQSAPQFAPVQPFAPAPAFAAPLIRASERVNNSPSAPPEPLAVPPQPAVQRKFVDFSAIPTLRRLHIPYDLSHQFLHQFASTNTYENIETCGILTGILNGNEFYITHCIIPQQQATADTCVMINEEELMEIQLNQDLLTLGWIHTHPRQTCFLSSIDLHTHYVYQLMLAEAVAIVMAPTKVPAEGIFNCTEAGLKALSQCPHSGFHKHEEKEPLYQIASHYVIDNNIKTTFVDLRTGGGKSQTHAQTHTHAHSH